MDDDLSYNIQFDEQYFDNKRKYQSDRKWGALQPQVSQIWMKNRMCFYFSCIIDCFKCCKVTQSGFKHSTREPMHAINHLTNNLGMSWNSIKYFMSWNSIKYFILTNVYCFDRVHEYSNYIAYQIILRIFRKLFFLLKAIGVTFNNIDTRKQGCEVVNPCILFCKSTLVHLNTFFVYFSLSVFGCFYVYSFEPYHVFSPIH